MLKSILKVIYEGKKVFVPILLGYRLVQTLSKRRERKKSESLGDGA